MFLYWDADKSGEISKDELLACMKSLGVKITLQECVEIVQFYAGAPNKEMNYNELLYDVQRGEPSLIAFVSQHEEVARDASEIHFDEIKDKFVKMPTTVKKFLEAVQAYLAVLMRTQGGTPYQHIRFLFQFYDYDYSNGLDAVEIQMAAKRKMKLIISQEQAQEIVDYYDRKQCGQINYEKFLEDVCVDVKPILAFTELSPRRIAATKASLAVNPFIPKPFNAPPNKILAKFKQDVKLALVNKVNKMGGSVASWIREAFVVWDPTFTQRITHFEHLVGAAKRLGVTISEEEARVLMKCYDKDGSGDMHYDYLAKEITAEENHFLVDSKIVDVTRTATTRTPSNVQKSLQKMRTAVDSFIRQSKGRLEGRDVFHGTCLRFDTGRTGRFDIDSLRSVAAELRCSINEVDLQDTVKWFDTNGSQLLDYNALTRQLYGEDVTTERLVLPRLKEASNYSTVLNRNATLGTMPTASLANLMTASASATTLSSFGAKSSTLVSNMEVIESQAVKLARFKQKRTKIIGERVKVEKKLASIDEQRRKIIEDYKARKNKV
jgi:Ca2+-binding EF-hand superfamily protein